VGYTAAQTSRLTGCTAAQLQSWQRIGLVVPSEGSAGARRTYSFRDLVALRVVASLLEAGLALTRIRRALQYLVESGDDVAQLRIVTDGESVWACRDDGQILDALRKGQLALFVAVGTMAEEMESEVRTFAAERSAFVDELQRARDAASTGAGDARSG
jgi:DNA-binding transcriptional MerR regulator